MTRASEKGFTLMETLLAITLFMIVMIAAAGIFSMGISLWKRTRDSTPERRALLAVERLSSEVRAAIRFRPAGKTDSLMQERMTYPGSDKELIIPSLLPQNGGGVLYGRVIYRWNPARSEVCRAEESAADFHQKKKVDCRPLVTHVRRFKVRYWVSGPGGRRNWAENWDGRSVLPAAVEMTLELEPARRGLHSPTIRKTVLIPAGDA